MTDREPSKYCQVANCDEPVAYICIESNMRYCKIHKHAHGMDNEHPHHFKRAEKYEKSNKS